MYGSLSVKYGVKSKGQQGVDMEKRSWHRYCTATENGCNDRGEERSNKKVRQPLQGSLETFTYFFHVLVAGVV